VGSADAAIERHGCESLAPLRLAPDDVQSRRCAVLVRDAG